MGRHQRPPDLGLVLGSVPERLREPTQWVCWAYVERNGKSAKCPISPTKGGSASSTDPATWGTFKQAVAAWQRCPDVEGVGFVFTPADPFAGIDLDKCIDVASGRTKPWALPIVRQLDSYAETSPSGTGVKVFVRARKKGRRCKTSYEDGAVEMYDRGRFFTVTGMRFPGVSADIEDRQAQYDAVYELAFGRPAPPSPTTSSQSDGNQVLLEDYEIVHLAMKSRSGAKFAALWAGRWKDGFSSHSEADSSLVFTLAFYTKDAGQIDRIFRQSGLMREKWDERHGQQTYGELTIAKGLQAVTRAYKPRRPREAGASSGGTEKSLLGEPPPSTIDSATGRLILSTERTLPTAEAFVSQFHTHREGMTLRRYAGILMAWQDNRYVAIEDDAMRNRLLPWLHTAARMTYHAPSEHWVARDFPANPRTVKAALESIKAYTHLAATTSSPSWLDNRDDRPNPCEIVPCRTSLLHLPTMTYIAPTPALFNVNALDYDHDPNAPAPTRWMWPRTGRRSPHRGNSSSWDTIACSAATPQNLRNWPAGPRLYPGRHGAEAHGWKLHRDYALEFLPRSG